MTDKLESLLASYGIEEARPNPEVNDVLAHYGIPGMKWGVRRSSGGGGGGSSQNTSNKGNSSSPKKQSTAGYGRGGKLKPKTLSDDELRKHVARIEMELKYAKLTAPQKSAGKKLAEEMATNLLKTAVTMVATRVLTEVIGKSLAAKTVDTAAKATKKPSTVPKSFQATPKRNPNVVNISSLPRR